ncbi:glycosyltransferase [Luminiphilus sp.]|nr:glycosyltransferase [Luminiphilus sp.]
MISFNTNPDHLRYFKFYQNLITSRGDVSVNSVMITTVGIKEFFVGILYLLRGYRVFHVIHDFVPHPGKKYFVTTVYNRVACLFFELVFHSRSQAKVYGGKCFVVPLPITGIVRAQTCIKGSFFAFGRFETYKNFDYIIALAQYFPDYRFVIASRGLEVSEVPRNVTIYSHFLSDDELANSIKDCQAVLLPYTSATQSGVIINAFEFSKPVIVSNLEGLVEYLSGSGVLGHSFNLDDPMSFQKAAMHINDIDIGALYDELKIWNSSKIL